MGLDLALHPPAWRSEIPLSLYSTPLRSALLLHFPSPETKEKRKSRGAEKRYPATHIYNHNAKARASVLGDRPSNSQSSLHLTSEAPTRHNPIRSGPIQMQNPPIHIMSAMEDLGCGLATSNAYIRHIQFELSMQMQVDLTSVGSFSVDKHIHWLIALRPLSLCSLSQIVIY